jgi:hypothetical protein
MFTRLIISSLRKFGLGRWRVTMVMKIKSKSGAIINLNIHGFEKE